MYTYDYDNYPTYINYRYVPIPPNTNRLVGHDTVYLSQLKGWNFNFVLIWNQLVLLDTVYASSSPSKSFLDRADQLDLKVILRSPGNCILTKTNPTYNSTLSDSAVNYYGNHPALIGWTIVDEPDTTHFSYIDQYFDDIESYDTNMIRHANLLPFEVRRHQIFGGTDTIWATPSDYEGYIQDYIDDCSPNILSFDDYPISYGRGSPAWYRFNFFYGLDIVARKSVSNDLPFIFTLAPYNTPLPNITGKNASEFNYVIYSALTYNAKGLNYWMRDHNHSLYWDTPVADSVKTYLADLHQSLIDSEQTLLSLEFQNAYHVSNVSTIVADTIEKIPSNSLWNYFSSDSQAQSIFNTSSPLTALNGTTDTTLVISFLTDQAGTDFFWVFNKSISNDVDVRLNFNSTIATYDVLNCILYSESSSNEIHLEPGEAKLYEVCSNFESTLTICSKTYDDNTSPYYGFYPDEVGKTINLGGATCSVNINDGANVNFIGESIYIRDGVSIDSGSNVQIRSITYVNNSQKSEQVTTTIDIVDDLKYVVFPNPNVGHFYIEYNQDVSIDKIQIINNLGKLVYSSNKAHGRIFEINLSRNLPPGFYFVRIRSEDEISTNKIVIK